MASSERTLSRRMRWIRVAFVVVVAVAFARVLVLDAGELRDVDLTVSPGWLALALPVGLGASAFLPLAWRHLVFAAGYTIDRRRAVRMWWIAQTGRYIPTGIAAFASRVVLAADAGVPRAITLATMAVELGLLVGISAAVAVVALPGAVVAWWLGVAVFVAVVAAMVAAPSLVAFAARRVPRLDPHRAGGWRRRELYESEVLFVANTLGKSLAFVLVAAALVHVDASDAVLLVGAMNAGIVVGMVGVTPAGIGVREGAIAALLESRYGLANAAALAVALRVWEVTLECAWLALVQLPAFRRRD
jgi:uncharacterized membrane protein YbhN (UPF0104 family)